MVLVAGYLVTIDPSFLSSLHPQPIPFLILFSLPPSFLLHILYFFLSLLLSFSMENSFSVFPQFSLSLISPALFLSPFSLFSTPNLSVPSFLLHVKCFLCLFSFFHSPLFFFSLFVIFPFYTPSFTSFSSLPLCSWASGQYQVVFTSTLPFLSNPVSLHLSLSTVLSFSRSLLGSHALRLYLCLWERRRPSASN